MPLEMPLFMGWSTLAMCNNCVQLQVPSACDVVVCTVGHRDMRKERLQITTILQDAGIRAEVQYQSLEVSETTFL